MKIRAHPFGNLVPPVATAVALMVAGSALAPLIDAAGKKMVASYAVFQIVWIRYAVHAFTTGTLTAVGRQGVEALKPTKVQLLRGAAQFGSTLFFMAALRTLSLTSALVIVFLAPLIVVIVRSALGLAGADRRSVLIAALGALGVLFAYAPQLTSFQPIGGLCAIVAAILLALYFLVTGHVAATSGSIVNSFHTAWPGAVLGAPFALISFANPTAPDWLILIGMGLTSALSHFLVSAAMRTPFSSSIAPAAYVEVPAGAFYAALLFGHYPTPSEIIGGVMVVVAGMCIALHLGRGKSPGP
ncbi:DMT family transporter [Sinorhizobium terangae]|uniref:DMT family transporter n=1 Tax=Sinorhizobium terangae TaxID=110322 RepID=UPI0024B19670|nr:DMT family transporter [Sinorhizobium terangae]WFU49123.1 DMT family transporter [Sinorhizobium terangae]